MANIPEQGFLKATRNESEWATGQDLFRQNGQDVLVWQDGWWEFWVVNHNGQMTRKTVYRVTGQVWYEAPFVVPQRDQT